MSSPNNPPEVPPVVDSSSGTPPEKSQESSSPVVAATSASATNDDSNPQQGGTGASRTPAKTAEVTAPPPLLPARQQQGPVVMMPAPQRPSMKIPPTAKDERKLFVGGLPADITNEEFTSFFAQFGSIIDSIVMFDFETGRSRGFGFVTYEDANVARHLLSMSRIPMRDKLVEVKAAQPKEGRGGRSHNARGGGGTTVGGGRRKVVEDVTAASADAPNTPEVFATAAVEGSTYPYGQLAYPAMPYYGYAPPPPAYGAPVYVPTPAPYHPTAGFVQGYVAPVYFPPEAAAATAAPTPAPAPVVMPEQQANVAAAGFAGYAYIPFAPPPAGGGFPPEEQK